jgi:hypothetical protein
MTTAAVTAFLVANKTTILSIALIISEALGAYPKVKSNGILSFFIIQVQEYLKASGAKDIPEDK